MYGSVYFSTNRHISTWYVFWDLFLWFVFGMIAWYVTICTELHMFASIELYVMICTETLCMQVGWFLVYMICRIW